MFEVNVKNVTEEEGGEGRRRRRGPARVWGSDNLFKIRSMLDSLLIYRNFPASWRS